MLPGRDVELTRDQTGRALAGLEGPEGATARVPAVGLPDDAVAAAGELLAWRAPQATRE